MFKTLFLILAIALSINFSTLPAYSADKECITETVTEILDKNKDVILVVHMVTGKDLETYLKGVNAERKSRGLWPLEADILIMSELTWGEIGLAMFDKNKCFVPGTFTKDNYDSLKEWFTKMGVPQFMDKFDPEVLKKRASDALPGA